MNMKLRLLGGGIAAGLVLVSCGALGVFLPDPGFGVSAARIRLSGRRSPLAEKAAPETNAAQAILLRQESRPGLPGFGDNAFPALYGEYRLETPAEAPGQRSLAVPRQVAAANPVPAAAPDFSVWVSSMDLYYQAGVWTGLSPINNYEARMRESEGRRLVSLALDTSRGFWTAIFSFSGESETAPLGAEQNRIIRAFAGRFAYFLSFNRSQNDVSLPAVLAY
jgi:hypothetical protein